MEIEQYIDLREYLNVLRKRWWIIPVVSLIFAIISGIVSYFFMDKVYEANTTLYVITKQEQVQNTIAYNDLMAGQLMVKDYREFIKQRIIAKEVVSELKLDKVMTEVALASKISVNLKNDTRIIEISVKDKSPEMVVKLADKLAEVFSRKVVEIMKVENVQIIDKAEFPLSSVSPNPRQNIAIAFFAGLMLSLGIIFVMEYLDNTIKTPDDVEKHLGLQVIVSIPANTESM